jgi:hypothetical protein
MLLRERKDRVHRFVYDCEVIPQILARANEFEAGVAKPLFFRVQRFKVVARPIA